MGQSTKKKRRRQNVYEGGQSNARKEMIMKKLRALKERRDNTRHSKQQKNAMDSFFGYINNTGRFKNVVDDEGKRHYEHVTAEMFAEFTTTLTTNKNGEDIMLKKRTYASYKSALYKLMKENGVAPSETLKHGIREHLNLIGRENVSDANKGIRSLVLGSPAWELDFFKTLCKKLLESGGKKDIWALCVLLFAFNLIARINRIFKLRLNHIGWESDSMYVIYADSKSDKQGNDRSPKHLYTNLNEPHFNLPFVFALYLLSSDFNGTGSIFSDTEEVPLEEYDDSEEGKDEVPSAATSSLMDYLREALFGNISSVGPDLQSCLSKYFLR